MPSVPDRPQYDIAISLGRVLTVDMLIRDERIEASSVVHGYDPWSFLQDVNTIAERHGMIECSLRTGENREVLGPEQPYDYPLHPELIPSAARTIQIATLSRYFTYQSFSSLRFTALVGTKLPLHDEALPDILAMISQAGNAIPPRDPMAIGGFVRRLFRDEAAASS